LARKLTLIDEFFISARSGVEDVFSVLERALERFVDRICDLE